MIRRKDSGPRIRNYKAAKRDAEFFQCNHAKCIPGFGEINSMSQAYAKGIYEQDESIYKLKEKTEEQKLFEVNESLNNYRKILKIEKKY